MDNGVLTAISNLGYPIAISVYLLFRFESKIDNLEKGITGEKGLIVTINNLSDTVKSLTGIVEKQSVVITRLENKVNKLANVVEGGCNK